MALHRCMNVERQMTSCADSAARPTLLPAIRQSQTPPLLKGRRQVKRRSPSVGGVRKSYQFGEAVLLVICRAFSLLLLVHTGLTQTWWSPTLYCMCGRKRASAARQIRLIADGTTDSQFTPPHHNTHRPLGPDIGSGGAPVPTASGADRDTRRRLGPMRATLVS